MVEARLAPMLGPFTARMAVRTFAVQKLGREPEQLVGADVLALLEALRPMLRTLMGAAHAELVLEDLRDEVERS